MKTFIGRNNFFSNYGMKTFFNTHKINVVLANYGISAAHMVPVCKALNIPLIVIFHGHDATNKKTLKKYHEKYLKLFDYASVIVAVSEVMKQGLIKEGANTEKIYVVPCGVDIDKFTANLQLKHNKDFLAVGRFTQKKGPLHTINAFNKVLEKHPDATLTMVGKQNGLFEDCEQLVKHLGIEKSVCFTGVLDQKDIAKLMQKSLAFVQHSMVAPNGDMEGTPVSIMEACASGLPVVSTFHGGIQDAVIHEKTGYLVEEGHIENMAKYMISLCDNPKNAQELGLHGSEHIKLNYNQDKQLKKLYKLAKQAITK
ncbi:glycosyltransferase family 4 protein [Aestuariibaculum sediminum]|uniref:glycosyltransferase family 4 protein n=1 Tax=Aestuariibaculum sediminum TaxID=2770637 RepID=UPI003743332E